MSSFRKRELFWYRCVLIVFDQLILLYPKDAPTGQHETRAIHAFFITAVFLKLTMSTLHEIMLIGTNNTHNCILYEE